MFFFTFSDADSCHCEPEHKIPNSRLPFFRSNLFDRGSDNLMKIDDLPEIITHDDDTDDENGPDEAYQTIMEDVNDETYEPEEEDSIPLKIQRNKFDYPESVSTIRRSRTSYESGFRIMNR